MQRRGNRNAGAPVRQDDADEIRACLRRLLQSPSFRSSARRARLLEYLCARTLLGEGDQITEYGIALDVFDKPASFEPRSESTVRAEVTRLRQTLKTYYEEDGANDPIVIELPPRRYVPAFTVRATRESEAIDAEEVATRPRAFSKRWIVTLVGIAVVGGAALALVWLSTRSPNPPPFSVAVLPASIGPAARDAAPLADGFTEELIPALASIPGVSVSDWMYVTGYRGPDAVARARRELPFALILVPEIDKAGEHLLARFDLLRRADGHRLWSGASVLNDTSDLRSEARRAVAASLGPLLERGVDIAAYRRRIGYTRIEPVLGDIGAAEDACSLSIRDRLRFRGQATVQVTSRSLGGRGPKSAVGIRVAGKLLDGIEVKLPAGRPSSFSAPQLLLNEADTCVREGNAGTLPLCPGGCFRPPSGYSSLVVFYGCTARSYPIDLSRDFNYHGLWNEETMPSGARILGGVPFVLSDGLQRAWNASQGGTGPVALTVPVKQRGISRAWLLLNTVWGAPGPQSYLSIDFMIDGRVAFEKKLTGGVDVRDYNQGLYTNTINGTTSRCVFESGRGQRMDMVEIDLPAEFQSQELGAIRIADTGRQDFQRAVLWGLTVQ